MTLLSIIEAYKDGEISTKELFTEINNISENTFVDYPLSEGQIGLWVIDKINGGKTSEYNVPIGFRILNKVQVDKLEVAARLLLMEYPILNSVIRENQGKPIRKVKRDYTPYFVFENISDLKEEEVLPYIKKISKEPISLNTDNLIRFYLMKRSEYEYLVLINVHHIVFDGSSIITLLNTFLDKYINLSTSQQIGSVEKHTDYNEYVLWEKDNLNSQRGNYNSIFWKEKLADYNTTIELPQNYGMKKGFSQGETLSFSLPKTISREVVKFCNEKIVNKSTFFLTVFKVLLYQYTGQTDCVVGMPVMQRPHEKFNNSIGYFINMIPIRHKINLTNTFKELVNNFQKEMVQSISHSDYPFSLIVKLKNSISGVERKPLVQVSYSYQNYMQKGTLEGYKNYRNRLSIDFLEEIHQEGEYDVTLEVFEMEDHFKLRIKYDDGKFGSDIIYKFGNNYYRLVQQLLTIEEPISDLPKVSEIELDLFSRWNTTSEHFQYDLQVQELFDIEAKRLPNSIAVVDGNWSVTYEKLQEKSNEFAEYLRNIGVGEGDFVGIYIERSINLVVALLGVLKSGAAFVPLDPAIPHERLEYIFEDSEIRVIITNKKLKSDCISNFPNKNIEPIIIDDLKNSYTLINQNHQISKRVNSNKNLAYLLYTSGSTGKPKGVMIPHSALTNFLHSMSKSPGIAEKDSLLSVTTFGFDIAFLEIFLPLVNGAKCILASTEITKDAEKLKNLINKVRPTIMQATPATWSLLFRVGWNNESNTKILCGGEPLTESLKEHFANTSTEVWNMFGPTETTIWSSIKKIEKGRAITIGKPIANTKFFVLDEKMNQVPVGVKGELYISGNGLALGYLNRPELTEERFLDNPFGEGKIYKTGDAARWTENGEIDYLGRMDNQIKLNGYRIELEEIEAVIEKYPGVSRSVVTIIEIGNIQQLRSFFMSDVDSAVEENKLKRYLREKLPTYMIPSTIEQIETLPLTSNGKVDRFAISKLATQEVSPKKKVAGKNILDVITSIVEKTLEINNIDPYSGFFEVGGDSMAAVVLVEKINDKFDINFTATDIFEHPTIFELTEYIEKITKSELSNDKEDKDKLKEEKNSTNFGKYKNSVAIIGISCKLPGANDYQEFWENLVNGTESIEQIPLDEQKSFINEKVLANKDYVPARATIDGKEEFDAAFFKISPKEAELMDPQMRLLLMNSWKAVEDAGYLSKDIPNTAVYTSTSNNSYHGKSNNQKDSIVDSSTKYTNWLLAQSGTISTMVSYYLGFTGPSLSVHSNCSSSLVGLDLGVKSIISGSTDYALVGASTIHSLKNLGYVYRKGLNFSSNGHIKAFDDSADGMIGGEGVAVVLLKNVEKAIQDGDQIYSIIRGVSTNNDGLHKAGFYAPSVKGQSTVIKKAMQEAGVRPESINFIEAHGTGTQLGDPIEFKALQSVFESEKKANYCGLGSVKTNIGHLDTVSGLVGCIKAALSINYRILPPTLNFKKPNKQILLEDSPFFIAEKKVDLSTSKYPIRAGISSFGIGGTNCHVILEEFRNDEYNGQSEDSIEKETFLIPISAKNEKVLKKYIDNLSTYLKKYRPDIRDVAFTMQVGRMQMESRAIFCVESLNELIDKLGNFTINEKVNKLTISSNDKRTMEVAALWLNGEKINWLKHMNNFKSNRISLPTYPFDMKEYWITPDQDSENEKTQNSLHPFVSENNSSFYSQNYSVQLNGNEYFIKDHVIDSKKILPGVFYIEMARFAGESALEKTVTSIRNIVWKSPIEVDGETNVSIEVREKKGKVSFDVYETRYEKGSSNAQGKIVVGDINEVMLPYDIEEIMNRCKNHVARDNFYSNSNSSIYDYGETYRSIEKLYYNNDESLAKITLPKCCIHEFDKFKLHPSILEGGLQSIVGLMIGGEVSPFMPYSIDEVQILGNMTKECFAYTTFSAGCNSSSRLRKYNIDLCDTEGNVFLRVKNYTVGYIDPIKNTNVDKTDFLIYDKEWIEESRDFSKHQDLEFVSISSNFSSERLDDEQFVQFDISDITLPDVDWSVKGKKVENLKELVTNEYNTFKNRVVFFLPQMNGSIDIQTNIRNVTNQVFSFLQSVAKFDKKKNFKILFLYQSKDCVLSAFYDSISAWLNSLKLEYPNLRFKTVKLRGNVPLIKEKIGSEFEDFSVSEVMFSENVRFVKALKRLNFNRNLTNTNMPIKQNGVYVVAGGFGSIGRSLTEYLVRNFNSKVIIIGRSSLNTFDMEIINGFQNNVTYIKGDIGSKKETEEIIKKVSTDFVEINGIFNCTGVLNDSLFKDKSINQFNATLNSKVSGTINLDDATKECNLDLFILFSSVSSLGNFGQTDYALANDFLNNFADYRAKLVGKGKRKGKTISICWPLWESGSMTVNSAQLRLTKEVGGLVPLPTNQGLLALGEIFRLDHNSMYLFYGDPFKMKKNIEKIIY